MEHQNKNTSGDIVAVLFQPKMILVLVFMWLVLVIGGSGIAILATQSSLLSDSEVDRLLSENESLALTAGVAYTDALEEARKAEILAANAIPAFPDRLIIPSLGKDLPTSNPQTRDIALLDEELKSSVVRYPDSATLGEEGRNVLIFGHSSNLPFVRNKMYKAFTGIQKLQNGELIQAISGTDTYNYRVSRVYRADAHDDRIALSTSGANRLTLLTCDTFGKKSDRWIVEADFVGKNI
ncbi:MAG: sortase [Candidatus Pacebacteria bacterium]|nr:sortase [Candidatus Paceibacterota bacterium]